MRAPRQDQFSCKYCHRTFYYESALVQHAKQGHRIMLKQARHDRTRDKKQKKEDNNAN